MKLNNYLFLLLCFHLTFGQYHTSGKLKKVAASGFHEIVLSPEIRSYSKHDLSDIRIFDSKGKEVPYFIQNNKAIFSNLFQEYTIISKKATPKKSTSIIIEVASAKQNNQISLFIANSNSEKKYTISGSNDQKEWFGISDMQILTELNSNSEPTVVKTISYPLSNYKFLKIDFDDQKTLPLNILKAGTFVTSIQSDKLAEVVPKQSYAKENLDDKTTEIHFLFDTPQVINQIVFKISQPNYYDRKAILYKKSKKTVKRKTVLYDEEIVSFNLNSRTKNTFNFSEIYEKEFFVKIENYDNPPLKINSVKYYQKPISLIADLSADESYTIKTGQKNLNAPEYDLSSFKNSVPTVLPQTSIYDIQQKKDVKNTIRQTSFWQQSWFMWVCIVLGGLTILYFTMTLVRDLKAKQ
ncbi:DUF3999 family protein [Flavobacterium foetidum]|uniref:DUF3999 family protein n=1 Tax=Flavobacterium foetidum TaxID=2026681 RepID=UPI001074FB41|nr:DUF3999 family protein [Flavobacterium foetidum]KAF2514226.1 DUF3999 family protein [Flavobacterium foetidum]